jgi:hypothetical protein
VCREQLTIFQANLDETLEQKALLATRQQQLRDTCADTKRNIEAAKEIQQRTSIASKDTILQCINLYHQQQQASAWRIEQYSSTRMVLTCADTFQLTLDLPNKQCAVQPLSLEGDIKGIPFKYAATLLALQLPGGVTSFATAQELSMFMKRLNRVWHVTRSLLSDIACARRSAGRFVDIQASDKEAVVRFQVGQYTPEQPYPLYLSIRIQCDKEGVLLLQQPGLQGWSWDVHDQAPASVVKEITQTIGNSRYGKLVTICDIVQRNA